MFTSVPDNDFLTLIQDCNVHTPNTLLGMLRSSIDCTEHLVVNDARGHAECWNTIHQSDAGIGLRPVARSALVPEVEETQNLTRAAKVKGSFGKRKKETRILEQHREHLNEILSLLTLQTTQGAFECDTVSADITDNTGST
ncbi:hypothetical protein Btru_062965 [Bulinus truncatus]|nr:hypothetical protein Btru_062965 [Bulinus truncatus]